MFLDVWNISDMKEAALTLCNRMSNGLERYDFHMGHKIFSTMYPSLPYFVEGLKEESVKVILRIESVRKGHESAGEYKEKEVFPEILEEYHSFGNHEDIPRKQKQEVPQGQGV